MSQGRVLILVVLGRPAAAAAASGLVHHPVGPFQVPQVLQVAAAEGKAGQPDASLYNTAISSHVCQGRGDSRH